MITLRKCHVWQNGDPQGEVVRNDAQIDIKMTLLKKTTVHEKNGFRFADNRWLGW
ncbi:hypothetical protein ACPV4B_20380 [Vibrio parahaemolyticus]|uniref:hypothetical protein n=1 Tax=Vibrio mediterranei TaxID=689 RepID=UPI00406773B6